MNGGKARQVRLKKSLGTKDLKAANIRATSVIASFDDTIASAAKGVRYAHGLHTSSYRESVLIRSTAEAKIREADRLECEAWNAILLAGGPAIPSPGDARPSRRSAKRSMAGSICWKPGATAVGSCPLLRALQRRTALPSPAAGAYSRADLCQAGSGARPPRQTRQAMTIKFVQPRSFRGSGS